MKATNRLVFLTSVILLLISIEVFVAQNQPASPNAGPATQGVGLIRNDPGAFKGYTLISPMQSRTTFLIDMNGRVVKTWVTESTPSALAYLQENGNLLRAGVQAQSPYGRGVAGGRGPLRHAGASLGRPLRSPARRATGADAA